MFENFINTLLNNTCVKEETKRGIRQYFEIKENKTIIHESL